MNPTTPPTTSPVPGLRIVRILGQDGSATVLLAVDSADRPAIVTVGHRPLEAMVDRMNHEAWIERLRPASEHPHIADVIGAGITADGRPFLAVRSSGHTLADRLRHGPLRPEEARAFGIALAGALTVAHTAGLTHGALRPGTILLGDNGAPLLAGFDIGSPNLGQKLDASPYTAPEHVAMVRAGGMPASPQGDVYALAATLYAALGGEPATPESGGNTGGPAAQAMLLTDIAGVSPALINLLRATLAYDPLARLRADTLVETLNSVDLAAPAPDDAPPPTASAVLLTPGGIRPVYAPGTAAPPPPPQSVPAPAPPPQQPAPQHPVPAPASQHPSPAPVSGPPAPPAPTVIATAQVPVVPTSPAPMGPPPGQPPAPMSPMPMSPAPVPHQMPAAGHAPVSGPPAPTPPFGPPAPVPPGPPMPPVPTPPAQRPAPPTPAVPAAGHAPVVPAQHTAGTPAGPPAAMPTVGGPPPPTPVVARARVPVAPATVTPVSPAPPPVPAPSAGNPATPAPPAPEAPPIRATARVTPPPTAAPPGPAPEPPAPHAVPEPVSPPVEPPPPSPAPEPAPKPKPEPEPEQPRRPEEAVAGLLDLRIPEIPDATDSPGFSFFPQPPTADGSAPTAIDGDSEQAAAVAPPPAPPRERDPAESTREQPAVAPAPDDATAPPKPDTARHRRDADPAPVQAPSAKPKPGTSRRPGRDRRTGGRRRAPVPRGAVLTRIAAIVAVVIAIAGGGAAAYLISRDSTPPAGDAIPANSPTVAAPGSNGDVADVTGYRGIRFGDKLTELQDADRVVDVPASPCGQRYYVAGAEGLVTLEFQAKGLAVLRVKKPVVHTPEGVAIGDPVSAVPQTYPDAETLPAAGTQPPALLVPRDHGRAYLFVGKDTVTDIVIGDSDVLTGLYRSGGAAC